MRISNFLYCKLDCGYKDCERRESNEEKDFFANRQLDMKKARGCLLQTHTHTLTHALIHTGSEKERKCHLLGSITAGWFDSCLSVFV